MPTQRIPRAALAAAAVVVAVLAPTVLIVATEQARYEEGVRGEIVAELAAHRSQLETTLTNQLAPLTTLVGWATADQDFDAAEFEAIAADLSAEAKPGPPRALQLAPNAVIEFTYPLEGNEAALGHDLLADPNRRDAVLRAIESRSSVAAGPVDLLQGGRGLIIRHPLFLPDGSGDTVFWGLATAVINFDDLIEGAGLNATSADIEIAIRGRDALGAAGDTFLGDASVFSADPVLSEVAVADGSWQLAATPRGGWAAVRWPVRSPILLGGFLVALIGAYTVYRYVSVRAETSRVRDELRHLVNTVMAPITAIDANGVVTEWNTAAGRMVGIERRDAVGRNLRDLIADVPAADDLEEVTELLLSHARTAEPIIGLEQRFETADGQVATLLLNASPRRTPSGQPDGLVIVSQDITARLESERIRSENHALARTSRLKDEFLASMSHELRTPLNGIIGLSTILHRETFGPLNEKQSEYAGQIGTSGRHLLSLINDVLDLAKIEAAAEDLTLGPVSISQTVDSAVSVVRELAATKGLTVDVDVADDIASFVGDERRISQVLINLLSNAVKFTDSGSVGVRVRTSGQDLQLDVWDTGIGIPEDKQALLFQPFQQVDGALDRVYGGTGLGLALASRLVELHGGTIGVTSRVGAGSTFEVRLPMQPDAGRVATTSAPAAAPPRVRSTPHVLVVEDNALNCLMLKDVLEHHGVRVSVAANGIEAVDLTIEHRPDLVLMDIQMPERDGLAATRILKASAETAGIPIVALTALAMNGDAERCLEAGCDAYLAKPYEVAELLAIVDELAGPLALSTTGASS